MFELSDLNSIIEWLQVIELDIFCWLVSSVPDFTISVAVLGMLGTCLENTHTLSLKCSPDISCIVTIEIGISNFCQFLVNRLVVPREAL